MIIIARPPFLLAFLFILCAAAVAQTHWKAVRPPAVGSRCASQITLVNHACSFLMLSSTPPPMPPRQPMLVPPAPELPMGRHRRGGGMRRHRGHHHSPEEEICCQWMKEVDNRCVCDMFANLPPFLARPLHQYTVMVGESCYQTFQCGSVIRSHG